MHFAIADKLIQSDHTYIDNGGFLDGDPFFVYNRQNLIILMDRQVLKGLVLTMKALVLELESEVFSDKEAYRQDKRENLDDPVEYFGEGDDDGYPD